MSGCCKITTTVRPHITQLLYATVNDVTALVMSLWKFSTQRTGSLKRIFLLLCNIEPDNRWKNLHRINNARWLCSVHMLPHDCDLPGGLTEDCSEAGHPNFDRGRMCCLYRCWPEYDQRFVLVSFPPSLTPSQLKSTSLHGRFVPRFQRRAKILSRSTPAETITLREALQKSKWFLSRIAPFPQKCCMVTYTSGPGPSVTGLTIPQGQPTPAHAVRLHVRQSIHDLKTDSFRLILYCR